MECFLGFLMISGGLILWIVGLNKEKPVEKISKTFIGVISGYLLTFGIFVLCDNERMKPMDVYQGKTTLQYTIVDSVKVDSVVVWKLKEE